MDLNRREIMRTKHEVEKDIIQTGLKLNALRSELQEITRVKSNRSSDQYAKKKKLLEEAGGKWTEILKPGDCVKVTGSGSSTHRKVIEIKGGTLISCPIIVRNGKLIRTDDYDIRTCGVNKITAYLKDDKWITYREILENA